MEGTVEDSSPSDHHHNPDSTSASSSLAIAGPSTSAAGSETKLKNMGKAPTRRNIRHILSPEEIGAETLEERRREQERQQRVNMMFASQFYAQQQQQHQQGAFAYPQSNNFGNYLTETERADIAARQAIWRNFKQQQQQTSSSQRVCEDGEIVVLSSDDEDGNRGAKRLKTRDDRDDGGDSAAEEDADSDCVCLGSDAEDGGEGVPAAEDVAAGSAHLNDAFNVPDAEGRILINVGHAESEEDVFLPKHLVNTIKPHQIGGLRFMYDNVVESLQRFKADGGFGCILAHSMGLGKTFQVVSFTDIVYRHTPIKRILLIVPVNTLQNWLHEFEMWTPKSSFQRDIPPRQFDVHVITDGCKSLASRFAVINEWYERTGVLVLGYEMFRLLSNKINGVQSKKKTTNNNHSDKNVWKNGNSCSAGKDAPNNKEEDDLEFAEITKALLDPGPDLVICDEGHRIKNFKSNTSKALSCIKTKRRIVLTGYPLQNNLMEYWCMVNFVRPNYLGSRKEFAGVFERPIKNGQCVDSTEKDIKVMRYRVHVLTNLLKGFVQRRSHSLLATSLPPKCEYVLFIRKSPIQHRLYRRFIVECTADIRDDVGSWNPLKAFAVCCKIWNHPDVLYKAFKTHLDAVDGDLDLDFSGQCPSSPSSSRSVPDRSSSGTNIQQSVGFAPFRSKKDDRRQIDFRWAEDLFEKYTPGILEHGMKMRLAVAIIEESARRSDKILIFSQSLLTLDALETFLNGMVVPNSDERWKKNRNYFRLDGSTNSTERQRLIARFNNERGVYLFLISTRAGCLGINLVGANRVIVFDASFNPCHDAQAVCRVYRYGQKKPSFIYRFVTDNSMEKTIFNRQLGKQGIADRIIDERSVDAAICQQDLYDLLQYNEEQDMVTGDCEIDPEKVKDDLLLEVCRDYVDCLTKAPVPHESLMLDRSDQQLSEAEKREAKRGYEREKKLLKAGVSGGGNIDWKRWHPDGRGGGVDSSFNGNAMRSRPLRQWTDWEPPQVRYTPMPMMLQTAAHQNPQMVNGFSPSASTGPQWTRVWPPSSPVNPHTSPTRPSILFPPNHPPSSASSSSMIAESARQSMNDAAAAPELITLSDDEA